MPPLDPIVSEFASTEEEEAYDRWYRAKVEASFADPSPTIPHAEVMAGARAIIERHRRARAAMDQAGES